MHPPRATRSLAALLGAAGVDATLAPAAAGIGITAIDSDSRSVTAGSLFVAVPGRRADGQAFIADAIARGAAAVVAERVPEVPVDASIPVITVSNARRALSDLAAAFQDHPSRSLCVVGITGTDGKTTTATLLWHAWRASGIAAASITTVDRRTGDRVTTNPSRQTTPEAPELHAELARIRDAGCTHVALETSSHALEMRRADGVEFRAAVFTRITTEHLELHGSRDRYLAAKARLLERVSARPDGIAVLDAGDPFAFAHLAAIPVATRLTYTDVADIAADLRAEDVSAEPAGVRFTARTPWGDAAIRLRLAGRFNVRNALAALAAACATGAELGTAVQGLEAAEAVTGRMERIDLGQPFAVVVDYAHTTDALETVLSELRPTTSGRLWAVFGSAGERDLEKRPAMGSVAARLADISVITDEDPRGEDRERIVEQIAAGAVAAGGVRGHSLFLIPDREDAIGFAVANASPGDTVLCAGKGHEKTLETAAGEIPWNERAVAEAAIRRRLS
ncbi:MAG TPA: UDP-N-acetylmuramoyl-L-alanyl-D-glutamate--2,6-diaminopimelate ligase [Candidatus Saccharimonadales bacterium]|nr:UDP-N-acetylmuramoyl-L-alanyl-D-glutamate--2,6-diaminopimelate ligase [Candidatus Saccharimonadales bacterium]